MWTRLMRRWPLLLAAVLGGVLVGGVEVLYSWLRPSGVSSDVLASIDGKPITLRAFQNEMAHRGGESAFSAPEQRRALLNDMIRVAVLAANAQKVGYSDDIEVRRNVQQVLADKFQRENIDGPLANLKVSDADVEDYYAAHASGFTIPESVHAAIIFVSIPAKASEDEQRTLQQRAQRIRDLAAAKGSAQTFAELASQYSDDASTRTLGGDIGWLESGQDSRWGAAVGSAIAELRNSGEVSPPITTPGGIYIVKLLERKPVSIRPLSDVRNTIRQQLIREERQRRITKLYADALTKVRVSVNEAGVAAMEAAQKALLDVPTSVAQSNG